MRGGRHLKITSLSHLGPMDFIQPMNIELVKIFKIERDIKPETAIELAQDLQDL